MKRRTTLHLEALEERCLLFGSPGFGGIPVIVPTAVFSVDEQTHTYTRPQGDEFSFRANPYGINYEWDFDYDGGAFQSDAIGDEVKFVYYGAKDNLRVHVKGTNPSLPGSLPGFREIQINVVNEAPENANAGQDQMIFEGQRAFFSGSATDRGVRPFNPFPSGPTNVFISGHDTLTYEWDFNYDGETFHNDAAGPNPSFQFLHPGIYTVAMRVTDSFGGVAFDEVKVMVHPLQQAPVAGDDTATTDEDMAVNVTVLNNDSDVDGDTLSVSAVTQGVSGAVTINADGTLTYTPAVNFHGSDSFTYTIADGNGGTADATVSIVVTPVNDAPAAVDDTYSTSEEISVSEYVFNNDIDVDAAVPLTVSAVNGLTDNVGTPITLPSGALLTVNADGRYRYDPNGAFEFLGAGQTATDSFTYQAQDGQGALSNTATVTITITGVNDAPVAFDDTSSTDDETSVSGIVLTNDTDVDKGDKPVVSSVNGEPGNVGTPITLPSGALLTVNADGSYTYTPTENNAIDSFTYVASDSQGAPSDPATVTITGLNDAPVAVDDEFATDAPVDAPLIGGLDINVLINDTDVDNGDTLTVAMVNGETGNMGMTIILASGAWLTVNADGGFIYQAFPNFHGTESFTYVARDSQGALSNTATVTITIHSLPDLVLQQIATPHGDSRVHLTYRVDAPAPLETPVEVALYATTSGAIDAGARLLGTTTLTADQLDLDGFSALAPGMHTVVRSTKDLSFPTDKVWSSLAWLDYYLVARVDNAGAVAESNETNNDAVYSGVYRVAGNRKIFVHGSDQADLVGVNSDRRTLRVIFNGTEHQYGLGSVDQVHVRLHGGDDVLQAAGSRRPIIAWGGAGHDLLEGGDRRDRFFGGGDDDTLIGNAGRDLLFGELGNDWLSGGRGRDLLCGGDGDDHLNGDAADSLAGRRMRGARR